MVKALDKGLGKSLAIDWAKVDRVYSRVLTGFRQELGNGSGKSWVGFGQGFS